MIVNFCLSTIKIINYLLGFLRSPTFRFFRGLRHYTILGASNIHRNEATLSQFHHTFPRVEKFQSDARSALLGNRSRWRG